MEKELNFNKNLLSVKGTEDGQPDQKQYDGIQERTVERSRPRNEEFIVDKTLQ